MRIRLKPVGRPQPFVVVRVPSTWEALTETARQRVYADLPPGASVHLFLADGAEVLSLDDIEADDVRGTWIRTRAYARECPLTHTHTRARVHTHTGTHAHTRSHTHIHT